MDYPECSASQIGGLQTGVGPRVSGHRSAESWLEENKKSMAVLELSRTAYRIMNHPSVRSSHYVSSMYTQQTA